MSLFQSKKAKKRLPPNGKWRVGVERDFCKACRFCIEVCPVDVFQWSKEVNALGWFPIEVAHQDNCVGCMLCYQVCPDFCLTVEPVKPTGDTMPAGDTLPGGDTVPA